VKFLIVAAGGALGSAARYAVTHAAGLLLPTSFPYGTFLVNAIGCLVFGLIAGAAEGRGTLTPGVRLFWLVGVLGGFTTFSSYAYDTMVLARGGAWPLAVVNAAGQVLIGLAFLSLGWWLTR
jgi:CrcB protein